MGFEIAGQADCMYLAYALTIARHLRRNLPHFEYIVILKSPDEWPRYIAETQQLYGFKQPVSPVIMEEGRLIGGLKEWKELVKSRYNTVINLTDEQCKEIAKEVYQEFLEARRKEQTRKLAEKTRAIVEQESDLFTDAVRTTIALSHHTDAFLPHVNVLASVTANCDSLLQKLQTNIIELQKERHNLEDLALRDAISKKNAQLALEWIAAKAIEDEAKELETQLLAEEAAAKKKAATKAKSAKKKKRKGAKEDDEDEPEEPEKERATTPKTKKKGKKGAQDNQLSPDTIKKSLDAELKMNQQKRLEHKQKMELLRAECEVYSTTIAQLLQTTYPEPIVVVKKKEKKKDTEEEGEEEDEAEQEEEEEKVEEEEEEEEEEGATKQKKRKEDVTGVVRNGQYIPLSTQGFLRKKKDEEKSMIKTIPVLDDPAKKDDIVKQALDLFEQERQHRRTLHQQQRNRPIAKKQGDDNLSEDEDEALLKQLVDCDSCDQDDPEDDEKDEDEQTTAKHNEYLTQNVSDRTLSHANLYLSFKQIKERTLKSKEDKSVTSAILTGKKRRVAFKAAKDGLMKQLNKGEPINALALTSDPLDNALLPFPVLPQHHSFKLSSSLTAIRDTTPSFIKSALTSGCATVTETPTEETEPTISEPPQLPPFLTHSFKDQNLSHLTKYLNASIEFLQNAMDTVPPFPAPVSKEIKCKSESKSNPPSPGKTAPVDFRLSRVLDLIEQCIQEVEEEEPEEGQSCTPNCPICGQKHGEGESHEDQDKIYTSLETIVGSLLAISTAGAEIIKTGDPNITELKGTRCLKQAFQNLRMFISATPPSGQSPMSSLTSHADPLSQLFNWKHILEVAPVTGRSCPALNAIKTTQPSFTCRFLLFKKLPESASEELKAAWNAARKQEGVVTAKSRVSSARSHASQNEAEEGDGEEEGGEKPAKPDTASDEPILTEENTSGKRVYTLPPTALIGTPVPKSPPQIIITAEPQNTPEGSPSEQHGAAPAAEGENPAPAEQVRVAALPVPLEGGVLMEKIAPFVVLYRFLCELWMSWCEQTTTGWLMLFEKYIGMWDVETEKKKAEEESVREEGDAVEEVSSPQVEEEEPEPLASNPPSRVGSRPQTERGSQSSVPRLPTAGLEQDEADLNFTQDSTAKGDSSNAQEEKEKEESPFLITTTVRRFITDNSISALILKRPGPLPTHWTPHPRQIFHVTNVKGTEEKKESKADEEGDEKGLMKTVNIPRWWVDKDITITRPDIPKKVDLTKTTLLVDPTELAKRHNSTKAQRLMVVLHGMVQSVRDLSWLRWDAGEEKAGVDEGEILSRVQVWQTDPTLWRVDLPVVKPTPTPIDQARVFATTIIKREEQKIRQEKEEKDKEEERKRKEKEAALNAKKKKKKAG
ncbi:hypothetical protein BLNAU_6283 [Blattamonas nauphoetae]|uniref:Uncharacterized protein n=1 Tax=Blattamonas nauphoetae TaxID=2049346 RepID=A0ABQ9Y4V9_9EUKA|nr:hypothetical protein BLNAU_6283 [Blattamonas nauphoetae]